MRGIDHFVRRVALHIEDCNNNAYLESIKTLLQDASKHREAIDLLIQQVPELQMTEANRNLVLDAIRFEISEKTANNVHKLTPLVHAHLIFVDCGSHSEFPNLKSPLTSAQIERIVGPDVRALVQEYDAVRNLLPVQPVSSLDILSGNANTAASPLPDSDVYTDVNDPQYVDVRDNPAGSYICRTISARNNDTAEILSSHFRCDVDILIQLNPVLADAGFGVGGKKGRLKANTNVVVRDYRING